MDSRRIYFQTTQATKTEICSRCKTPGPQLTASERAKHRFCSCCGAALSPEVDWKPGLTIDELGAIVPGPAKMVIGKPFGSVQGCLSYLDAHPGQVVVVGAATAVLGGGLVLVAAPLAALAAVIFAGGVTILKVSVVGGVLTAVCAASSKDAPVGAMLKGVGIVALAGSTTIAAAGVLSLIAGLCGLLGGILMTCGGIAIAAVVSRQLYLQHQTRKERLGIPKNLENSLESPSLSQELLHKFFPN